MFRAVHQILPYFAFGDAIGNQVLELRQTLRAWGYRSEIFAENWDSRLACECLSYNEYDRFSSADNLLILHYSIGGEVNRFVLALPDRVVAYYHNITPAHFFYWANGDLARQVEEARRDLQLLVGRVPAIAASPYNAEELRSLGFTVLGIAPYILTLARLDAGLKSEGAAQITRQFAAAGKRTWLYVGRLVPNKCIQDIIKAFYYYHTWITPESRLLLVGADGGTSVYVAYLRRLSQRLNLEEAVVFAGHHGAGNGLAAFYKLADLYVSMSEHEGFCVPLVEAMYYGVPVLAYASTGVPYTMGEAGLLLRTKDYAVAAEMVHEVLTNERLRACLVAGQQRRVEALGPDIARSQFRACLDAAAEIPRAIESAL